MKDHRLREKIKKVLENRKDIEERIYDKHGNCEYGLDLLVIKKDIFGKLRAYGIQIKTGDIKCSGDPNNRIKEIIGQAAIALGKEIEADGKTYRLEGIYIITDGEFLGNAKEYLDMASKALRGLYYLDRQALEEFFVKYGKEEDEIEP